MASLILCIVGMTDCWFHLRRLVVPEWFLNALRNLLSNIADDPIKVLTSHWNRDLAQAADTVTSTHCHPSHSTQKTPWFTEEPLVITPHGQVLEWHWRKAKKWTHSNWILARVHQRASAVAVAGTGTIFFLFYSAPFVSAMWWPAAFIHVTRRLLHLVLSDVKVESLRACCDTFASHFTDKIVCIWLELDSELSIQNLEAQGHPSLPVLWDDVQFVQSDVADRILGSVRSTSCMPDCCPSWLISGTCYSLLEWLKSIISSSLQ